MARREKKIEVGQVWRANYFGHGETITGYKFKILHFEEYRLKGKKRARWLGLKLNITYEQGDRVHAWWFDDFGFAETDEGDERIGFLLTRKTE